MGREREEKEGKLEGKRRKGGVREESVVGKFISVGRNFPPSAVAAALGTPSAVARRPFPQRLRILCGRWSWEGKTEGKKAARCMNNLRLFTTINHRDTLQPSIITVHLRSF